MDVFLRLLFPSVVVFFGEGQRGLPSSLQPDAVVVDQFFLHVLYVLMYGGGDVELVPVSLSCCSECEFRVPQGVLGVQMLHARPWDASLGRVLPECYAEHGCGGVELQPHWGTLCL